MNTPVKGILLYTEMPILKQSAIESLCEDMHVEMIPIYPGDYHKAVGYVAGAPGIKALPQVDFEEAPGELLVMVGMMDILDDFLDTYNARGIESVDCKAVLTKENAVLSAAALYEHLKDEHEKAHNIEI